MVSRSIAVALVAAVLFVPMHAFANPKGGVITLAFGDAYVSPQGGHSVHRGVDVACEEGDRILAPVPGEISFAGRVPSASGSTMLAVSIRMGEDTVTLMPFERIDVSSGDVVSVGATLGRVAPVGDPSSPGIHVHVGLRRGSMYLDPTHLLDSPPAVEAPDPVPTFAPAPAPAPSPAVLAPSAPVIVSSPAPEPLPITQPAPVVLAADPAQVHVPESASPASVYVAQPVITPVTAAIAEPAPVVRTAYGTSRSSAAEAPSPASTRLVVEGPTAASPRATPFTVLADAARSIADAAAPALHAAAERGCGEKPSSTTQADPRADGWHWLADPLILVLAITVFGGLIALMSRRALEHAVSGESPVSDRLGSMLQQLRAGDTLCGLTSCSGLLPSQSRGRSAQRR